MPLAKDVVAVENAFINLLQHIPGTKVQKQTYFIGRGIRVPRTNYEMMWEVLTSRLHHSGAASAVFGLLKSRTPGRLAELLRQARRRKTVSLRASEPALVDDLFFRNGKLRRIGELFLEEIGDDGMIGVARRRTDQTAGAPREGEPPKPYDIALSFAGENRSIADEVARELRAAGIRVFYDIFEQVSLLGKDLAAHFAEIYRKQARYCAMFVSAYYVSKAWPTLERQHAQARALAEKREYILPIRLDGSEVPGLSPTIGYLDARNLSPKAIAQTLAQKVRGHAG